MQTRARVLKANIYVSLFVYGKKSDESFPAFKCYLVYPFEYVFFFIKTNRLTVFLFKVSNFFSFGRGEIEK